MTAPVRGPARNLMTAPVRGPARNLMTAPVRGPARAVVTLVVSTVAFAAALTLRDLVDPWRSTSVAAVLGGALSAWTLGPRLRPLLGVTLRGVATSALLGAALVAATHAAFALVRLAAPSLAGTVRDLYVSIDLGVGRLPLALLTLLIVIGEELVWRGVAVDLVRDRPRPTIAAISVALYVAPQIPGHVPVLIAAAVGLGTVFAAQRLATGRLTDAILTHAIWSVAVFVVVPVT